MRSYPWKWNSAFSTEVRLIYFWFSFLLFLRLDNFYQSVLSFCPFILQYKICRQAQPMSFSFTFTSLHSPVIWGSTVSCARTYPSDLLSIEKTFHLLSTMMLTRLHASPFHLSKIVWSIQVGYGILLKCIFKTLYRHFNRISGWSGNEHVCSNYYLQQEYCCFSVERKDSEG